LEEDVSPEYALHQAHMKAGKYDLQELTFNNAAPKNHNVI